MSEHQAKQLQRQVFINDRVKTMNESVYYNVDDIHSAINQNKKIRFKYYKWDINKKLVPRHGGVWFVVSPWVLMWDDENYYMVAYDDWDHKLKHYRVCIFALKKQPGTARMISKALIWLNTPRRLLECIRERRQE